MVVHVRICTKAEVQKAAALGCRLLEQNKNSPYRRNKFTVCRLQTVNSLHDPIKEGGFVHLHIFSHEVQHLTFPQPERVKYFSQYIKI